MCIQSKKERGKQVHRKMSNFKRHSRIIYFLLSFMFPPHTVNAEHRDRLQSSLWNSMSPPAGPGSDPAQESRLAPLKPSQPLKNEVISYWLNQHQQIKNILQYTHRGWLHF